MNNDNFNSEKENQIEEENNVQNGKKIVKEEVNLQFHWYIFPFIVIYLLSYFFPGVIFMLYVLLFFHPYFLEAFQLNPFSGDIKPLIALLTMPALLIGLYLLHLFLVAVGTRYFWRLSEKIYPSREGVIPRNVPSKTLNFYHIRSFLIKYGKAAYFKGAFPWLAPWFFNFVGSNIIGKGTTMEEEVCGDKFIEVGENCYLGPNSTLTSHLVEGIFGNIPYFKVRVGDNVTFTGDNSISPGCNIGDNSYLLPLASASKYNVLKGNNYYFGIPLRKIFKKKVAEYLNLTPEQLKMQEDMAKRQKQLKAKKETEDNNNE
ncbi:MAG: acyltransferase [Promethearchaeia archaeon]